MTFGFDACIGGARGDEEQARAKERISSFHDAFGQWDPKYQRPELRNLYIARTDAGANAQLRRIVTRPCQGRPGAVSLGQTLSPGACGRCAA